MIIRKTVRPPRSSSARVLYRPSVVGLLLFQLNHSLTWATSCCCCCWCSFHHPLSTDGATRSTEAPTLQGDVWQRCFLKFRPSESNQSISKLLRFDYHHYCCLFFPCLVVSPAMMMPVAADGHKMRLQNARIKSAGKEEEDEEEAPQQLLVVY